MPLPTADAYNDAIQTPRLAFPDPVLAGGIADCNGFGIPKAVSGGFAITYRINGSGRAFAVRCFQKEAHDLQDRYRSIHKCLQNTKLAPFVEFEYQQNGIRVKGSTYPIVKMEWIAGTTLGEYLEANHANRQPMESLRKQFACLEQDLARCGLAHGDLQNGNVLVERNQLRLVDYDGMFVSGMPLGRGTELGHKNFQHPLRRASDFGPDIDRFSFIVIDLSLWALCLRPDLFKQFSTGENILFSANDFADPDNSRVFQTLVQVNDTAFKQSVADFACVCKADFKAVPRLKDFLARTGIPRPAAKPIVVSPNVAAYIAALPVVDAGSFEAVCNHVGARVEMIGQVVEVKTASTRKGAPYVFINFRHWRDKCVRVTIWSEGLKALGYTPDSSWIGQWLVINGMIDPVYHGNNRYKTVHYVAVGLTVTDRSQIHKVSKEEAMWRLGKGPRTGAAAAAQKASTVPTKNAEILTQLGGDLKPSVQPWSTSTSPAKPSIPSRPPTSAGAGAPIPGSVKSRNEEVLKKLRTGAPSSSASTSGGSGTQGRQEPKGCAKWVAMLFGSFLLIVYMLIKMM
jgi:hypothetical protein